VTSASALTVRKQLIAMARRRVRPGSGSPIEFLRRRDWREPKLDLRGLHTPYVIVGGVATALYMPQRVTVDTDILVAASDAPSLHAELRERGLTYLRPLSFGGSSWQAANGEILDVLESDAPWAREAVSHPNRSPSELPVITLPYLILLKLASSRAQDVADLSRMLGQADAATRDEVRAAVRAYRPEDSEDLESLIALGDLELS